MVIIEELPIDDYEIVIKAIDTESGLTAFIAVHDTTLGPAMGGCRIYPYDNQEQALEDALRLAKGMTYKSALCQTGLGGGKSVIIANPETDKTPEMLHAFGEAINYLQGKYIVAEDVGSTTDDMMVIREKSPFVAALETERSSGDPSRFTAWGVFKGIQAISQTLWGKVRLKDRTIAIQGLGNVGSKLANILFWEGADLILSDINEEVLHQNAILYGAQEVPVEEIHKVECDIFAPCALGGILNQNTIPELRCRAIGGAANNQLLSEKDGERLHLEGILYAPDYVINSGGIINAAAEFNAGGYDPKFSRNRVNQIYDTLKEIFARSLEEGEPTNVIANRLAEYNLEHEIGKRDRPIEFTY